MNASDYIAITSACISIVAIAYTHFTNTKKYELLTLYRNELLTWFTETSEIIIRLKLEALQGFPDSSLRRELLAKLSANIEKGRFYFPNILNNYGLEKSLAYRGYRNVILDFLVFSYHLFARNDAPFSLRHAETLQKYFTSNVFEIINPRKFLSDTERETASVLSTNLTFEEYMANDPDLLETYIKRYNNATPR
jgi:hypothetical protein